MFYAQPIKKSLFMNTVVESALVASNYSEGIIQVVVEDTYSKF